MGVVREGLQTALGPSFEKIGKAQSQVLAWVQVARFGLGLGLQRMRKRSVSEQQGDRRHLALKSVLNQSPAGKGTRQWLLLRLVGVLGGSVVLVIT